MQICGAGKWVTGLLVVGCGCGCIVVVVLGCGCGCESWWLWAVMGCVILSEWGCCCVVVVDDDRDDGLMVC